MNPTPPQVKNEDPSAANDRLISDWLRSIAVGIVNCSAYGVGHAVTQHSIDDSFHLLEQGHKLSDAVEMRLVKDGLQVNGRPFRTADILGRKLRQLPVQSVMLTRGMNREDYGKVIHLIHEGTPAGSAGGEDAFFRKVEAANIQNLTMRKSQFVEMYEVVVSKDQIGGGGAGGSGDGDGSGGSGKKPGGSSTPPVATTTPTPTAPQPESRQTATTVPDTVAIRLPTAVVGKIIAFLNGSAKPAEEEEARKAVQDAAGDTQQLTSLILKAVASRQQEAPLADLSNIVVSCLRRALSGMRRTESGSLTQKAQQETIRALTTVEAHVLVYMQKMADEGLARVADAEPVKQAIQEIKLQLEAETLVNQLKRHRSALADSSKALAKLIARNEPKQVEAAGVRELLLESGLTPEEWHRLVLVGQQQKSSHGKQTPLTADDGGRETPLTSLLANLTVILKRIADDKDQADNLEMALSRIDGEVSRRIAEADSKIDRLAEAARRIALEAPTVSSESTNSSRHNKRQLIMLIADVSRDIRLPLSVIQTSSAMLQAQAPGVGTLTPVQQKLVALVEKSQGYIGSLTQRLEQLL